MEDENSAVVSKKFRRDDWLYSTVMGMALQVYIKKFMPQLEFEKMNEEEQKRIANDVWSSGLKQSREFRDFWQSAKGVGKNYVVRVGQKVSFDESSFREKLKDESEIIAEKANIPSAKIEMVSKSKIVRKKFQDITKRESRESNIDFVRKSEVAKTKIQDLRQVTIDEKTQEILNMHQEFESKITRSINSDDYTDRIAAVEAISEYYSKYGDITDGILLSLENAYKKERRNDIASSMELVMLQSGFKNAEEIAALSRERQMNLEPKKADITHADIPRRTGHAADR